ncbi:hypothetical protein K3148_03635 [Qipengyuania aurantiaca]|uniref:Uncharacterized protein n=1 Tax=Qipengyuania aurantiaca TaxID=2867233 RepID=A0ABX8ZP44_9SPHN|nr:hypothetical protein [Qipengyuania aurantiaca]QZD90496.1 hypothetical protein K3148_03635 [Qipengyuania aurantiaca]
MRRFARLFTGSSHAEEADVQYQAKARLYRHSGRYFISSVAGISEYGEPSVLEETCENERLGEAVLDHIGKYREDAPDQTGAKLTDWRVYQMSGARSVKSFEAEAWHVDLARMNSAILVWARPRVTLNQHLAAYGDCNRHDAKVVGDVVRQTLDCAAILRDSGAL